jgi:hypothetical protein
MTAEAWIALAGGLATILTSLLVLTWYLSGRLSKQDGVLIKQDSDLINVKSAVVRLEKAFERMQDVIIMVAEQKAELQSLREMVTQAIKRSDETFSRVFDRIDNAPRKTVP